MKRYTKQDLDKALSKLNKAKDSESTMKDKYSTNYPIWIRACEKINKLKINYNRIVACYNYDNGSGYINIVTIQ